MLHIPVMRFGRAYETVTTVTLSHHAREESVAVVSQANSGMIARDIGRMSHDVLERFTIQELFAICKKAAKLFMTETLPIGSESQSFDQYLSQLSATTGMPVGYCRSNAEKICRVLDDIDVVVGGLTRGIDLKILDRGYGSHNDGTLSYFRAGRTLGAVLPSNSPGVHSLWIPAIALKTPVILKPGGQEPWSPYRIAEAFFAAGLPREAIGLYPTDHAGAGEILRCADRAMLFGDAKTTAPWRDDPRVEIHGPGFSKLLLGDDVADNWQDYLDVIATSIEANGGRSCINASSIWTPRHGRAIAEALGKRFAAVEAYAVDDPRATLAAFSNPVVAEHINAAIDHGLQDNLAVDVTQELRGSSRLARIGKTAFLLPTVIWCEDRDHDLANREFLFPYSSVVECPVADMPGAIGPTLVASVITKDQPFIDAVMSSPDIDRLNIGPIPTWRISWDQPHEGNLFENLYRQRAFQIEPAA